MAIRTLGDPRSSLLVCDGCDVFMTRAGAPALKPHRDADPDDLAPHWMPRADLEAAANSFGWVYEDDRWSCPPCSSKRTPSATR